MCKINFYLLPSKDYKMISNEDLLNLDDNITSIIKDDKAYVPNEFYEISDCGGINGIEYLYGQEQSDLSDFLLQIVLRHNSSEKSYEEVSHEINIGYTLISESDIWPDKEELCVKCTNDIYENGIFTINDLVKVKRYYLLRTENYDMYRIRSFGCFPALVFHEKAFDDIKKLGRISETIEELSRHLTALNDYGNIIYNECDGNEARALNHLGSKCNITCSGKGSNERGSFKKQMDFLENPYIITCNSHTKFYNGYNDQRIYFSWGRDEICNHKIIIISIGSHWN